MNNAVILQELAKDVTLLKSMVETLVKEKDAKIPPMSRRQFAAKIDRSVNTVCRMIERGELRTECGKIPGSELRRYLT